MQKSNTTNSEFKKRRRRPSSQPSPQNLQTDKKQKTFDTDSVDILHSSSDEHLFETSMSNSTAAPVVSISQEDIVRIAQTVKEFLIGDLHNLIDEKQKPVLRELKELKIKYDDLDKKVESFQDIITVHESSEVSNNLKAEIKYLKNKCDDLEQHSRKYMLRFTGVPFSYGENTDNKILQIASQMHVQMSQSDIVISHRTGKQHSDRPRPIIIRLSSHRVKESLLRLSKFNRKNPQLANISINQELTMLRSKLAYYARFLVRNKKLKSTWVVDGKIYIVDNKDDKHIVRNNDDFIAMLDELEIEPPTEWSEQPDEAPAATRERLLTHDDDMSVITGDVGNGGR
ncbi:unnamed protein product [Mytilus edulis]|uniref:Uncharacterized protein n=1 Tax=Mytilus edulis TaxID=6550 RepID=A0A8S3SIU7_MYTED|nr:unnamed protein product [Mytilus edulis]